MQESRSEAETTADDRVDVNGCTAVSADALPPHYRAIPLAVLRDFARDEAERSSIRALASVIGVGRGTLSSFIEASTSPHPRVKRLVALWYLSRTVQSEAEAAEQEVSAALECFVRNLLGSSRQEAGTTIIDYVTGLYKLLRAPIPPRSGGTSGPKQERLRREELDRALDRFSCAADRVPRTARGHLNE